MRRPGLLAAVAAALSCACTSTRSAPTWVEVHDPDRLSVALDGVTTAWVASADALQGYEAFGLLDPLAWNDFAETTDFWGPLVYGVAAAGTLAVFLGPDGLSCDDLVGGALPPTGQGLVLRMQWWSAEGDMPGWAGEYPVGSYATAQDGLVARLGTVGVYDRGAGATLDYLAGAQLLDGIDVDLARGSMTTDVLDLQFQASFCEAPDTGLPVEAR